MKNIDEKFNPYVTINRAICIKLIAFAGLAVIINCILPYNVLADIKDKEVNSLIDSPQGDTPGNTGEQNAALTDEEKPRGLLLYENHCHVCHESNVHIRANRKAKSKQDISYWVNRWSEHLQLKWNTKDKQDVSDYLNSTYYHYNEDIVE